MRHYVLIGLICIAGPAGAQTQPGPFTQPLHNQPGFEAIPHPLLTTPPAQPPVILNPLPPQQPVDLRKGDKEVAKVCTREVFYPCPDERTRNCTRKETYRCD